MLKKSIALNKEGVYILINRELLGEIRFIGIGAAFLDVFLFFAALLFTSPLKALVGILIGTMLVLLDMFFLSLSVESIAAGARRGKDGSRKMKAHYALRMIFVAVVLGLAWLIPFSDPICAAIPLFYPKVIYPLKAIFKKKEG